jgi:hypothetical protein
MGSKNHLGQLSVCSACGEAIIWLQHERTGKLAPITVAVYPNGNIQEKSGYQYRAHGPEEAMACRSRGQHLKLSHFANCPNAKSFKR